jgi:hypothetical protein
MFENCPNKNKALHNIQEATIVNNAACTICKIYVILYYIILLHKYAPLSSRYVLNILISLAHCYIKSTCVTKVEIYSIMKIT